MCVVFLGLKDPRHNEHRSSAVFGLFNGLEYTTGAKCSGISMSDENISTSDEMSQLELDGLS